jgi:hypothetical protein
MGASDWERDQNAFIRDGSLRDLYVLDTTLQDWQRLLDFLRASDYPLRFGWDEETVLPQEAAELFADRAPAGVLLRVDLGGPGLNCHFFREDEIEFDLDPRAVGGPSAAEAVFSFMRRVGQALNKPVRLTPENMCEAVLFEYEPTSDQVRYCRDYRAFVS